MKILMKIWMRRMILRMRMMILMKIWMMKMNHLKKNSMGNLMESLQHYLQVSIFQVRRA